MAHINIEIKARCSDHNKIREVLNTLSAVFIGKDHQIDTYFDVQLGRLKLREGNIENALIYYEREEIQRPKKSQVILYRDPAPPLKAILSKAMDVLVIVDKQREIYFIGNVKFNLDTLQSLGSFVEIEAIDEDGTIGEMRLHEQCKEYFALFEIADDQLIAKSYSDLLLKNE